MKKKIKQLLSKLIYLLFAFFVVYFLYKFSSEIINNRYYLQWPSFALSLIAMMVGYVIYVFANYIYLVLPEKKISYCLFAKKYLKSSLVRYTPGNVWAFLVRYKEFKKLGISSNRIIASIIFEMMTMVSVSFIFVVVSQVNYSLALRLGTAVIIIFVLFLVSDKYLKKISDAVIPKLKMNKIPAVSLGKFLLLFLTYILIWSFWGLSFWLMIKGFGFSNSYLSATYIFAFSWLIGYLSFIAPSGMGAREGVMILLLNNMGINTVFSTTISLYSRLIFALAEIILFGVVNLLSLFKKQS